VDRAARSRATVRHAARMARRMASSCANVNDILASFLPVRDIGEAQPAMLPFGIRFSEICRISAFAFGVMFTRERNSWIAGSLGGIVGTIRWYFLGLSMEASTRRLPMERS